MRSGIDERCAELGLELSVDGRRTGIVAKLANTFLARAVGLLGPDAAAAPAALQLRPCAAVHSCGMRRAIDVVFVDASDRVLDVVPGLRPWRTARHRGADAVWELPEGAAARLGIRAGTVVRAQQASEPAPSPGAPCPSRGARHPHQRGMAMAEFVIAGVLVVLPLTFATLELAQLVVTRHALEYATFEAARTGALTGASPARMRAALARGLVPLFAPVSPLAVLRSPDGGAVEAGAGAGASAVALVRATGEVLRPDLTRLRIENPTAAAAADFAVVDAEGRRVIPNDGLESRNPLGATSGQTLREANILAIRVRYCRALVMPLTREFLPALLRWTFADPLDQACLAQRRLPIDASAVVHMQSPAQVDGLPAAP